MNAALRDYALLYRIALAKFRARNYAVLCCLALLFALFVGMLTWMKTSDPFAVVANCLRAVFGIIAFAGLVVFVPAAVKMNTPANAVLVPRLRRRLMGLTVLVWLFATVMGTLLASGSIVPVQIAFLAVGLWIVGFGLFCSGHQAGMGFLFLLPMAYISRAFPVDWIAWFAKAPVVVVASLLMLALGAYTVKTMFPCGGDRHFRQRAAQALATNRMSGEEQFRQPHVSRLGLWAYRASLARDCARRDAGALLMHVLGPATHWTQRFLPMVVFVATATLVMAVARHFAPAGMLKALAAGSWVVVSSALFVQVFDHHRRLMRLSLTGGEQNLVRLAPAMPGAADRFNRRLGGRLLLAGLGEWVMVSAAVLLLLALIGVPAPIRVVSACFCFLTLPLAASSLRNHARRSVTGGWWPFVWLLVSLGVCLLAGALMHRMLGTSTLLAAVLAAVVWTGVAVAWRWRRLAAAPHAFPVGRLA
ncbi:hypothetical protein [Massilia niabensis]|uniref:ABC transporter permease n=1 Tax=Massilia niabensis TaxID=544910 RepID=A0ABW0L0V9_9BURK